MAETVIRVLVVDDHPVVRGGLVGWLDQQPDLEVVGEAGDGLEALARVAETRPDVVLMDLRMPRMDGVTAIERLAAAHPAVRVLVLTTYDTDADIVRAVEAGATGYLLKDAPLPQLAEAVRAAARGETVLAPPVAARLVSRLRAPAPEAPTPRELEVLAGVARGLTNAEIGRELFIGEATVKTHLLRVFAKLGVDDRTRAVMVAVERGLLPGPGDPPRS
jgi:DNA-binding NarL/FixJ family response regulator